MSDLSDLLEAPTDQHSTFSFQGELLGRWMEKRARVNDEGWEGPLSRRGLIPNGVTCHLKLRGRAGGGPMSFYLSGGGGGRKTRFLLPLGLVTGATVRLDNVRKVVSGKGNTYLMPTEMTNVICVGRSNGESHDVQKAYLCELPTIIR